MNNFPKLFALAVISVLTLSGCTSQEPKSAGQVASTIQPSSEAESPEPSPSAIDQPYAFKLACTKDTPDGEKSPFSSFRAVWASGQAFNHCVATSSGGSYISETQRAALTAAGYKDENLNLLYAECGATASYYITSPTISTNQTTDIAGMAALCPDSPYMEVLLAKSAAAGGVEAKKAEQEAYDNSYGTGIYRVGEAIEPGTYVIDGEIKNCYWERLDSSGNIIANNFLSLAQRVEVTIDASDYSFHTEGCGRWVNIN